MTQLIDKSALLEYLNQLYEKHSTPNSVDEGGVVINDIEYFLDTLEVKEVDLEREIGFFTTKELLKKRNFSTSVFHLTQSDIDNIAKHFFELGLKAMKGELRKREEKK